MTNTGNELLNFKTDLPNKIEKLEVDGNRVKLTLVGTPLNFDEHSNAHLKFKTNSENIFLANSVSSIA